MDITTQARPARHRNAPVADHDDQLRLARTIRAGTDAAAALDAGGHEPAERRRLSAAVRAAERARDEMVCANLGLVGSIARRYAAAGDLSYADLCQEGTIGLMRAVERFDPDRGFRFSTYATFFIRAALQRAVAAAKPMKFPDMVRTDGAAVARAVAELAGEGLAPTAELVADRCHITVERAADALAAQARVVSLDAPLVGTERTGADLLADASRTDDGVARAGDADRVAALLDILGERDAAVIRMRFGIPDSSPHTLAEVGAAFGITKQRVRQIEARALNLLRRAA